MNLRITIPRAANHDELRSLQVWLSADPTLSRTAPQLASSTGSRNGSMGGVLDVLLLALGGTIGAGELALGIAAWRRSRTEPPTVELNRDGMRIVLRGHDDDELRRLIAFLQADDRGPRDHGDPVDGRDPEDTAPGEDSPSTS